MDNKLKRAVVEAAGYQIMTPGETESGCYALNAFESPDAKSDSKHITTFESIDMLLQEMYLRVMYTTFDFLNINDSEWFHYPQEKIIECVKLAYPAYFAAKDEKSIEELAEEALNAACYLMQTKLGVNDGGYAGIIFSCGEVKQRFIDYINGEVSHIKAIHP